MSPREEYTQRLDERSARARQLLQRERRISVSRLVVFLAGVGFAWVVLDAKLIATPWLAMPVLLFVGLLVAHEVAIRGRRRSEQAAAFYARGLARLDHRWAGSGSSGERYASEQHPYGVDLDLFGSGSLFELLSTARTRAGEDTLAEWLSAPATPDVIRARQAAVAELRPGLDLREDLAILGTDVQAGLEPAALMAWSTAPAVLTSGGTRLVAALLATAAATTLALWGAGLAGPLPFVLLGMLELAFTAPLHRRVAHCIHSVERPARDLALLSSILARLERERFTAPQLVALRAALDVDGQPPSRQIANLRRLIELLDARRNQLFGAIAAVLLWATQLAFAIEAWRARSGAAVPRWLAAVGEFEALCALASYSYEHPDDPFPELGRDGAVFRGESLGHPLLPDASCVRNDVHFEGELRLLIVSGSNMSGKSTLLRTVGLNAVLAQAGAPVRARALSLSPLAVGAAIRIHDSLQTGTSHFYAEIKRLRQLVDITAGPLPLLFLLDEILHGTNSHDRRIGAEAVIRELVSRGAIGLVTTHDLALARIAEALAPRASNVHFEDHLEDGKMMFDYRMRPGVVEKSNALALMRAVGLRVAGDA